MSDNHAREVIHVSKPVKAFLDLFIDGGFCGDHDHVLRGIFAHCNDLLDAEHGFIADISDDPQSYFTDITMALTQVTNEVASQMQSLSKSQRKAYEQFFSLDYQE
ncbi:MAG: hypothetical protein AAGD25_10180 [Cyanobacteria bacterium P01_F01_bin.150]